jgi:hypothetical protein
MLQCVSVQKIIAFFDIRAEKAYDFRPKTVSYKPWHWSRASARWLPAAFLKGAGFEG